MTMANQKIQYTEDMVGEAHATKSDTLNRLVVGVNNFRLIKSGANLTLEPVNGNLVDINGKIYAVTTLPTLAPTALSPDTNYYIYLYDSSGTATLEASATGYTVDSKGRANKTGDATRRLMGLTRVITGPAWSDTAALRLVISYSNRRVRQGYKANGGVRTSSAGAWAELNSAERVNFLAWGDEALMATAFGVSYNSTASANTFTAIGLDGTTPAADGVYGTQPVGSGGTALPTCVSAEIAPTLGWHYTTVLGYVSSNTGSWQINTSVEVNG